ncbi:DUF1609 domain-containing protein [Candidatus Cardinium hertigii]|uniref:DUF1609 domain-containing protein n=1 Tax=Candidatus Cardinium hertigii TaxID=247481 RepID=UPI003D7E3260
MLRSFFSLNIILFLFSSCIAHRLAIGENFTKAINSNETSKNKESSKKTDGHDTVKKSIEDIASDHLERTIKGLELSEKFFDSFDKSEANFIEFNGKTAMLQHEKESTILELYYKYGTYDAIPYWTKWENVTEDKKAAVVDTLRGVVISRAHLSMGLAALATYSKEKKLDYPSIKKDFGKINNIADQAEILFKKGGEMFGKVITDVLINLLKYVNKSLRIHPPKPSDIVPNKYCPAEYDIYTFYSKRNKKYDDGLYLSHNIPDLVKTIHEEFGQTNLAIINSQYEYKYQIKAHDIYKKVLKLSKTVGKHCAAQFYIDAISIFEDKKSKYSDVFYETRVGERDYSIYDLVSEDKFFEDLKTQAKKTKNHDLSFMAEKAHKAYIVYELIKLEIDKCFEKAQKIYDTITADQIAQKKRYSSNSKQRNQKKSKAVKAVKAVKEKAVNTISFSNSDKDVSLKVNSLFSNSLYTLHPRVTRWETATEQDIANFDLHKKRNYSKLTDKAKRYSRCVHYLPGAECLLSSDDAKKYFFDTNKGVSAFATMQIGDDPAIEGVLEFGIDNQEDKKIIYHAMFNDNIQKLSQIKSPILEEYSKEDQKFSTWSSKSTIAIENDGYEITINDPFNFINPTDYPTKILTLYPKLGYKK